MSASDYVGVPTIPSGKLIDNTVIQRGSDTVYRQRVEIYATDGAPIQTTGLTDTQLRATAVPVSGPLTDTQLRATAVPIVLADGVQLDAFSRLRVSEARTLFDSQQEYGLNTLQVWDATANGVLSGPTASTNGSVSSAGNDVGPTSATTGMTPITSSATNGHYAVLQSRQYTRYIPGKSHLVLLTGIFATAANPAARLVIRSNTSGSPVDTGVSQASWNIDPFDGTGPSGITIDFTKTQILFIQAQWLGVGRVVVGFDIDGMLYPAHQFLHANNLVVPYTRTFNLPIRLETRTINTTGVTRSGYFDGNNGVFLELTNAGAGGTMYFICCSVQSEGGEESRGFPYSGPNSIISTTVTTRRPILSIRPKTTYNSQTNRAHIQDIEFLLRTSTNDCLYELVINGTLTGAAWTSVSTESVTEFDTTATAISGGGAFLRGYSIAGSGSTRLLIGGASDLRNPLVLSQIDALTATQNTISLVCTSTTGNSVNSPIMNWHEQTI